jgi:DNA-binding SARP family transcriptional activator
VIASKPVAVPGPRQRAVLAMLATHANEVVSVAALVDAVWGDPAPDRAEHTLQQHVSAVRKLVGSEVLVTRSPGYVLNVDTLDAHVFRDGAAKAFDAAAAQRWDDACDLFRGALALWRGVALADVRESERLNALAVRYDEQRLAATETWLEARLQCDQAREVVPEIEHLVADYPLRERLRALLMLALYRSGRQADALSAYQDARRTLVDELGIEPGAELRDLETAILTQSPTLDRLASGRVDELYATFKAGARVDVGRVELPDGQVVLLGEGVTLIGRDPSALVHLVDNRVSRRHAEIDAREGSCFVRDLASTNGTAVNGEAVIEQQLRDGDVISFGGVEVRFRRQ